MSIRPICANDSGMEQEFIRHLSKESHYFRFMASLWELSPKKLRYFTEIDYDRHMAFVATIMRDDKELESGVARYIYTENPGSCEFGITVDDAWHSSGVAGLLMILSGRYGTRVRVQDDGGHRAPGQRQDAQIRAETWLQNPLR